MRLSEVTRPGLNGFQGLMVNMRWSTMNNIAAFAGVSAFVEVILFMVLGIVESADSSDTSTDAQWDLPNAWWLLLIVLPAFYLLLWLNVWMARRLVVSATPIGGLKSTLSQLVNMANRMKEEEETALGLARGAVQAVERLPQDQALKAVQKRYELLKELNHELYLRRVSTQSSEDVQAAELLAEHLRIEREVRQEFQEGGQ